MAKLKEERKEYTADRILQAACQVFAEHGFAGSSISMLAKAADINQSLIYHHFGNKEELWKAAKAYLLRDIFVKAPAVDEINTLEQFVTSVVTTRFTWYKTHPEIIRMLNWQRLEPKDTSWHDAASSQYDHFMKLIPHLQKQNLLRGDLPCEMVMSLMTNMIVSPLLDQEAFMASPKGSELYLSLITKALIETLKP